MAKAIAELRSELVDLRADQTAPLRFTAMKDANSPGTFAPRATTHDRTSAESGTGGRAFAGAGRSRAALDI